MTFEYKLITEKEIKLTDLNKIVDKYDGKIAVKISNRFTQQNILQRYSQVLTHLKKYPQEVLTSTKIMSLCDIPRRTANRDIDYLKTVGKLKHKVINLKRGKTGVVALTDEAINTFESLQ